MADAIDYGSHAATASAGINYGAHSPAPPDKKGFLSTIWDMTKESLSTPLAQALSNAVGDGRHVTTVAEHYENVKKALEYPTKEVRDIIHTVPGGDYVLSGLDSLGKTAAGILDFGTTPAGFATLGLGSSASPVVRATTRLGATAINTPAAIDASAKFGEDPSPENFGPALSGTLMAAAPILPDVAAVGTRPGIGGDIAAGVKGTVKGAAKAAVETTNLRRLGLNVPVPTVAASAGVGATLARAMGVPPKVGAVVGGAAPIVRGGIRGLREALDARKAAAALPDVPEVVAPPPISNEALATQPITPEVVPAAPEPMPASRQLEAGKPAIPMPAVADTSGPIPTDPATGYPLRPGQEPTPVAPATPAAEPESLQADMKLKDGIAQGFGLKNYATAGPYQKIIDALHKNMVEPAEAAPVAAPAPAGPIDLGPTVPPGNTITQELEAHLAAKRDAAPIPAPEVPAPTEPPANPSVEHSDASATLTKGLIDGGIKPDEIAALTPDQWKLAGEALGVEPTEADIAKVKQAVAVAPTSQPVADQAGSTVLRENAPDSVAAPAGAPVFDKPQIMTEDAVIQHANDNGIPYADARKHLTADGYSIMNRSQLNRALHSVGSELGLDHEALSQAVRSPYASKNYKSMAQMSQEEMLAALNELTDKRAIRDPLVPKTPKQ